jgi:hypothetical protein
MLEVFQVGLLDLLFVIAAILVIFWLIGLVAFSIGPILYLLLVLAIIIIVVRLVFGRRV